MKTPRPLPSPRLRLAATTLLLACTSFCTIASAANLAIAAKTTFKTDQVLDGIDLTATSGFKLDGNVTLTLGAGGLNSTAQTSDVHTLSVAQIKLRGNQTWTLFSPVAMPESAFTVNSPIDLNGAELKIFPPAR